MPYFCEKSGVRTCVPGLAVSAGGSAPEHTGSDRHHAAEAAAACVIGGHVGPPTPQLVARAVDFVVGLLGGPQRESSVLVIDDALLRRGREPGRPAEQQLEHDDTRTRRPGERERERASDRVERPRKSDAKAPPPAGAPDEAPASAPKVDAAPATETPASATETPAPTPAAG